MRNIYRATLLPLNSELFREPPPTLCACAGGDATPTCKAQLTASRLHRFLTADGSKVNYGLNAKFSLLDVCVKMTDFAEREKPYVLRSKNQPIASRSFK